MDKHSCDYDIAIIGGGLGGLTLAIQAAGSGYRVVLFEKEEYPYHKVCGEYISFESYDFLQRCGIGLDEWKLPSINRLHVSDMSGKGYDFLLPLGGFGVSRYRLDHALYQIALQKGTTIITGAKVTDTLFQNDHFTITANGETHTAYIAAGCFGKRSNLDIKWSRDFVHTKPNKINNFIAVKYHIRYPHPKDTSTLHNFQQGYCGMSAIEDGNSCLCYLTTAENLKRSGNSIPAMEKNILSQNTQLKKILTDAEYLYDQPLTISQISFQHKTQIEDHMLMIGDAAGMITPVCGNGMSMAMHAAKIAFENMRLLLDKKITRSRFEENYTREWKKLFAARTRTGRIVQSFFGGRLSTSFFLQTMHAFPVLSKFVIKQTHGESF